MDFFKDLAAPVFLLILGVVGKWIVKRKWDDELLFMGPDLLLAAVGADIAHLIDFGATFLLDESTAPAALKHAGRGLFLTGVFLPCAMGIYIVILKVHQWLEPNAIPSRKARLWVGGVITNVIGLASMAGLLFLLRRI